MTLRSRPERLPEGIESRAKTRELGPADLSELEGLVVMASFPPDQPVPADAAGSPHVQRWLESWPNGGGLGVVALREGRIVGAALARTVEPPLLSEDSGVASPEVLVAVEPSSRGGGVGRQLLEELAQDARDRGLEALVLAVSDRNPAIELYRSVGFQFVSYTKDGRSIMRLPLGE